MPYPKQMVLRALTTLFALAHGTTLSLADPQASDPGGLQWVRAHSQFDLSFGASLIADTASSVGAMGGRRSFAFEFTPRLLVFDRLAYLGRVNMDIIANHLDVRADGFVESSPKFSLTHGLSFQVLRNVGPSEYELWFGVGQRIEEAHGRTWRAIALPNGLEYEPHDFSYTNRQVVATFALARFPFNIGVDVLLGELSEIEPRAFIHISGLLRVKKGVGPDHLSK